MPYKPPFVQKTITSCLPNVHDQKVIEEVTALVEKGYKVNVIVHEPVFEQSKTTNFSQTTYTTTILASASPAVDIS